MSETVTRPSGHCLCGAVAYEVHGPLRPVWNCHCWRCRRWTGHFMAATNCRLDDLRLLSDESLSWHRPADDPNVAYGFCTSCGASLFWRVLQGPGDKAERVAICAGTLDAPTGLSTEGAVFTVDASDYHTLDPAIESLTLE